MKGDAALVVGLMVVTALLTAAALVLLEGLR